jgi:hypothetical protein
METHCPTESQLQPTISHIIDAWNTEFMTQNDCYIQAISLQCKAIMRTSGTYWNSSKILEELMELNLTSLL